MLSEEQWAEIAIVSDVRIASDPEEPAATIGVAPGEKCARCWRVLTEVGKQPGHPTLCVRCTDAVELGAGLPGLSGVAAGMVVLAHPLPPAASRKERGRVALWSLCISW